jgi:hypothetical protein
MLLREPCYVYTIVDTDVVDGKDAIMEDNVECDPTVWNSPDDHDIIGKVGGQRLAEPELKLMGQTYPCPTPCFICSSLHVTSGMTSKHSDKDAQRDFFFFYSAFSFLPVATPEDCRFRSVSA